MWDESATMAKCSRTEMRKLAHISQSLPSNSHTCEHTDLPDQQSELDRKSDTREQTEKIQFFPLLS